MARRKRGRRSARHNFYSAGALVNRKRRRKSSRRRARLNQNRPRRRSRARSNRRRSYRRNLYMPLAINRRKRRYSRRYRGNPGGFSFMGIQLPAWQTVLWVGAGLVVPPVLSAQIIKFIPDSWKTGDGGTLPAWLTWVVKAVSAFVPPMLVRRFVNARAGNLMLVGAGVSFAMDLLKKFAPGLVPGIGYQPMLGAYTSKPGRTMQYRQNPRMLPPQISEAPDRLSPQARF